MNIKLQFPKIINHNTLFLFGALFYLVSPLICLQNNYFDGLPAIDSWKLNALNPELLRLYIYLVFQFVFCFIFGSHLGYKYLNVTFPTRVKLGRLSSKMVFIGVFLFVGFFLYSLRGNAFQGGTDLVNNDDGRLQGILSTAGLLVFYVHFAIKQPPLTKTLFLILLIITDIFLLGLGGRMYVIIPAVAYFIRFYNKKGALNKTRWPYIFIPISGAVLASALGAIRLGLKPDQITYFLFAEPIFTSYSTFSFLHQTTIPFFNTPVNFFSSILNFIPSLVWPNKAITLGALAGHWANYDNPLGALSIFVSIYGDFGIIPGGVFMLFFGMFFGMLYKAYVNKKLDKSIYYCFCSVLPFCFFRDPIGVPLKIFITSFGIVPLVIQLLRNALLKQKFRI